jgi:hypothetical protein
MLLRDGLRLRTPSHYTVHQQPGNRIARPVKEIEHRLMPLHQSNLVRIRIKPQRPLVDCAASPLTKRWKLGQFSDTVRHAAWIFRDQPLRQRHVAKRGCEEDVRFRATPQQESRHIRRLADTPLGWRRVVIVVAGVDASPMIQEQRRYRHGPGAMQGSPRVHSFRVDQRRVTSQHLSQLSLQPCPSCIMHRLVGTVLRHFLSV